MLILAITSCTSGLAHTYIAKERLEQTAKKIGVDILVETQGAMGIESNFTTEDIEKANAILIASDIDIDGVERFATKKTVHIPINKVVRNPEESLNEVIHTVGS